MAIVEGVGGVPRSDFTKNQDIRYKKINKNKKKSDRPTLCKTCYVTLNTYIFSFGLMEKDSKTNIKKGNRFKSKSFSTHLSGPLVACSFEIIPQPNRSPGPRYGHVAVSNEKNMFVYGGKGSGKYFNEYLWVFDTQQNSWAQHNTNGDRPTCVYNSRATLTNHYIILFGGWAGDSKYSNDVHRLNIDTLEWERIVTTGAKPKERYAHVQWHSEEELIVFGGYNGSLLNETLRLNMKTMHWTIPALTGNPPSPRYNCAYSQRGDEGFLFGGVGDGSTHYNDIYAFNFTTNVWRNIQTTGTLPCVRSAASMNVVREDDIVICGGAERGFKTLADCWVLNVENKEWKEIKEHKFDGQYFHTSCSINEHLYIYGGLDESRKTIGYVGNFSFV